MLRHFSQSETSALLGVPVAKLRDWARIQLVKPSLIEESQSFYNIQDLICLSITTSLFKKNISAQKIKDCLDALRARFPESVEEWRDKRIYVLDGRVIVSHKSRLIDTHSSELLLKFDVDDLIQLVEKSIEADQELLSAGQWYQEGVDAEAIPDGSEDALQAYQHAVKEDPDFADAFVNMGRIYFQQKKYIDAQRCFRQAIRKAPYHAKAAFNLANVLDELSCTEEAVQWYERAVEAEPGFADAYFNLARATETLGDWDKAVRYWKAYLQFDSKSEHAKAARRRIQLLEGELAREK